MKNKLLLIILLSVISTFLLAADTNFATNKEATIKYSQGLYSYNQKNYENSFNIFSELVDKYPGHELINYYYGRSAFELKKYDFALAAYDRILISKPDNHRVRLEYARTLFLMQSYKEAKKEFEAVLASPIPQSVRLNVEKFLQMIKQKEKNYILNRVVVVGLGWDNNVNNNTYESYTDILGGLRLNNNTDKRSDTDFKAILVGNLIVPSKSNDKLSWESTGVVYAKEQNHYHDNDIFLISLESGIGYTNQKYKNLTSFTYDHVWLGGDQILYIYGLKNTMKYNIYKNHLLTLDLKYKKKKMIQDVDSQKHSNIKEIALNYLLPLPNKDKLNIFTSYASERKEHGTRIDISKDTNKYKLSYTKNIFETYSATLGYQIEKNRYKDVGTITAKREDDKRDITLGVVKKIDNTKSIMVELSDIKNDSNINLYTYKKRSVNLNYTFAF